MNIKKILAILALAPALCWAWQPTKPVTVIFPNGPGAGNEISFRIVADIIEKNTNAKFVSEYKPGADGILPPTTLVQQQMMDTLYLYLHVIVNG